MKPLKTIDATRRLTLNGDPETELQIYDMSHPQFGNVMVSNWELSAQELEALNCGGTIQLKICGTDHPVVSLNVFPEVAPPSGEKP
jgi:hypothetical protein